MPNIILIFAFFVLDHNPKYIAKIASITCIKLTLITVEIPNGHLSIKYKKWAIKNKIAATMQM